MSLSAAAQRFRVPGGTIMVLGAALAAGLLAVSLAALPLKLTLAVLGVAIVAALAIVSRRPRAVLLGLSIGLISLDVKSFPANLWLHATHIGGAPGIVLTAQFALLIPLAVLAVVERAGSRDDTRPRLPAGALLIPLLPILAALPSLFGSRDQTLSAVELVRMGCFYLLYLYFAAEFKPSDTFLVAAALMASVLIQLPFVAAELAIPSFRFSFIGGSEAATALETISGYGVKRVTGTLVHANVLGAYLSLLLPIALAFAVAPGVVRWLRALGLVALLAGLPMLVLTFNRGAWIGFAIAVPFVLILGAVRGHLTTSQTVGILATVTVLAVVSLALPPVWDRFAASDPGNVDFRLDINRSAMAMWQAYPWTGAGLNVFAETVADFDVRNAAIYRWPVHNIYLLWLSETGIVGTAGMVVFLIWAAFRIIRASAVEQPLTSLLAVGFAGGVLALYVGELASFGTRFDPVAAVFYILLGVMVAMGRTSDRPVTLGRLGQLRVV